jgi:hypothetical protein
MVAVVGEKNQNALRRNPSQAPIEGLARHGVMQNVPSRPEVMLRNDDLLIFVATMPVFFVAPPCCNKRELLPFVSKLEHRTIQPRKV